MDVPAVPDLTRRRRARDPLALWLAAALAGFMLGGAALASSAAARTGDSASALDVRAL